jgi:hypothetical protein
VTEKVIEIRTPKATYHQIRRYFTEMGIDNGVMPLLLSTPADRLRWLTRGELRTTRLATHSIGGADLLLSKTAPPAKDPTPEPESGADGKVTVEAAAPAAEPPR